MAKLIEVEKVNAYLGTTYRFYVQGMYMGTAPTRARALEAGKEALESLDFKKMERKQRPK